MSINSESALDALEDSERVTGDWRNAQIAVERAKAYALLAIADALGPPVRYIQGAAPLTNIKKDAS